MPAHHHVRIRGSRPGRITLGGVDLVFAEDRLACPTAVPVRALAAALYAQGIDAAAVAEISPGLAAPCRLVRFDTHGNRFVIEEPLPELIALLKLARFESAVHKQGYEVERL